MNIHGGCHCGNLVVDLNWPDDTQMPVRCCTCSFCRKHGGEWTSHPGASLTIRVGSNTDLNRYQFGTQTADFLICARCGIPVAAVSKIRDRSYAVVNVNALEIDDGLTATPGDTDFDAESISQRLARRSRNWIPDVIIEAG